MQSCVIQFTILREKPICFIKRERNLYFRLKLVDSDVELLEQNKLKIVAVVFIWPNRFVYLFVCFIRERVND